MKRLITVLAAAVAVLTVSARVTDRQAFESGFADFVSSVANEDSSVLGDYASDQPTGISIFDIDGFGDHYLSLDTGDATLWRTNAAEAAYFDMVLKFVPTAAGDEPEPGAQDKVLVYMDADTNIVVISGTAAGNTTPTTNTVTVAGIEANEWVRLSISAKDGRFFVYVNGTSLDNTGYYSLSSDATIKEVGFSGSGALDNFVARTTDPFIISPAANVGAEGYASLEDAFDDYTTPTNITLNADAGTVNCNPVGYKIKKNGHSVTFATYGSVLSWNEGTPDADGYTTYTGVYFPRTETAGQDGTAGHPYEVADADDLVALQDYVLADSAARSLCFVQTADINMTGTTGFYGIGWFRSTDEYDSLPTGATKGQDIVFAGTYDGQGYTISNVQMVRHNYAGVFNCLEGTVKDLTVSNFYFTGSQGEQGCGIIGNAQGDALVENVISAGTAWGWDTVNRPGDVGHNSGGIACRAEGNATFRYCVNNATINSGARRLGGIVGFTGTTLDSKAVKIVCCTNNGDVTSSYEASKGRGVGGILASPETYDSKNANSGHTNTIICGCANFGTITASNTGNPSGAIVGTRKVGTNSTFVDAGGNTFLASANLVGDKGSNAYPVIGLAYALPSTIEGQAYLTTVAQDDLAAGNTYTLLADVTASATPVYTFDAAGTIAFNTNGFNFAGTVASVASLGVVGPVVVDSVLTYSAGVAAVDDVAYATFDAAVAALDGATDDYVTLLADVSVNMTAGDTLKVKIGTHTFSVNDTDVIVGYSTDENNVTTVTAAAIIATTTKNDVTTPYATLQAAIAAAVSGDTVTLVANSDEAVTIPAGKTILFVEGDGATFSGTFDGAGTVSMSAKPKATSASRFAQTWTGTFQVAWDEGDARFVFDDFGNANSTVEVVGTNGAFRAFPFNAWTGGDTPTINTKVSIAEGTTWTVANGNAHKTDSDWNITGTLSGARGCFKFGDIYFDGTPDYSDCLLKFDSSTDARTTLYRELAATTVNGAATTLVVGSVSGQRGVYLARATVAGVGYVTVADAIAAAESDCANTVVVLDGSSATFADWTYENGTYTYADRAFIGETGYPTLADALTAAGTEDEVTIGVVKAVKETVGIPAKVTVAVANGVAFNGTVSGAGTIVYTAEPSGTLAFNAWTGTVSLNYANIVSATDFAAVANARGIAGSWVEIGANGTASGYMNANLNPSLKVTGFMEFKNGSSTNSKTIPTLTGDGTVVFTANPSVYDSKETTNYGVTSLVNWNGVITNGSTKVTIGSIVSGSGKVAYKNKPESAPTIGEYWTGTFVADWTGSKNERFDINAYGNANSVVEVTKLAGGYVGGSNANVTVIPTVNVSGSMLIDNGYSGKFTTFSKLTGSGVFSTMNYSVNVTTLENFTGTFTPLDSYGLTISYIGLDSIPASGTKVVALGEGAIIRAINNTKVVVGGVEQDIQLEVIYGDDGYGIYVKPKIYEITFNANGGSVDPATTNYTADTAAFDLPIPTLANYTFLGWTNETIAVAFTNFVPGTTTALGDLTLYASWTENTPAPSVPIITPTNSTETAASYTLEQADDIVAAINGAKTTYIAAPEGIAGTEAAEAYSTKFAASKVLDEVSGKYKVVVELTPAATATLTTDAGDQAATLAGQLSTVAATSEATSVALTGAEPGFYYSVGYATTVGGDYNEGTRAMAGSDGTVALQIPAKSSGATAGFYKVLVNIAPKNE